MSINLTNTNQSLELVTTTTTQTQVVVSARDNLSGAQTPVSQDTNVTTAATTTIEAAPGASTQRMTDDVEVSVVGAGSQGIKIQKNVGGTLFQLLNVLLSSGERAHFTNDMGWRVFDALGREKNKVGFSLLKAPTLINTGTTGTYTPSVGCTAILLEIWGAGGQGGGSGTGVAANAAAGSGGSAGCYSRKFLVGVPASFTYSLGVGGSGAAGTANGNAGTATTVTINGVVYSAAGGPGGLVGVAGAASGISAAAPAAGSTAGTNCDESFAGQVGNPGIRMVGTGNLSGQGGMCSNLDNGSPGTPVAGSANGVAATGNGNGGSGGSNIAVSTQTGGAGTLGAFRVWEFTS